MSAELLVSNVGFGYGGRTFLRSPKSALSGISMTVGGNQPKIIAIVGESGSGKTTLARLLLGLLKPSSGTITLDGRLVSELRGAAALDFRRRVQAVLQDPYDTFNPFYFVEQALSTPLNHLCGKHSPDDLRNKITGALQNVGLQPQDVFGRYPHELSGGQRQRIMIARALLLGPDILVADEPVSMVDASMRATILEMLYNLNRKAGIAVVYITHDLMTANQIADETIVLYGGRIMERGPTEHVLQEPLHPYTQELIAAIPSMNPDRDWNLAEYRPEVATSAAESVAPIGRGRCTYLPKCRFATERCREIDVAEVPIGDGRSLACIERTPRGH